ncbi:hypothetical protein BDL97_15G057500 [Sphagnum fallax]|nr:hypothetical protein BDL97_15G057500 [Sphagnum fallax]
MCKALWMPFRAFGGRNSKMQSVNFQNTAWLSQWRSGHVSKPVYTSGKRLIDANNSCINAEIRTRIPESIPREYIIDDEGNLPISFAVKIDLPYDTQQDLFIAFQCNRHVSHRYKYKFLRATTSQIPNSILKDNRGSKVTIGSTGLLKVQHLISVRPTHAQQHHYMDPSQVHARVSYIEFYVMPDEDDNNEGTQ